MPGAQGQITIKRQRNGNGIREVTSYFALSASRSGVTRANTSGWTATLLQPTMELPYLWRYLMTTYTAQTETYTTPELVATYLSGVHPNLLAQTDFKQISLMDKWDVKSQYEPRPGQTASDTVSSHIVAGIEGNNAYYDSTENKRSSTIYHKSVLQQVVYGTGHTFLNKDTWYTLSFWAKGTSFYTYIYGSQTCINTSAGKYADGIFSASNSVNSSQQWTHGNSTVWTKHTFTFKTTSADLGGTIYFLVRLFPPSSGSNTVSICMPKIEIGMLDTGYCLSVSDSVGLSGPAVRNFENGLVSGQRYYCNDPSINTIDSEVFDADGIRHADFITVLDDTANVDATGYAVYQCIRSYTASDSVNKKSQFAAITGISTYFLEVTTSAKTAFFTYLLAKNAYIKFLSGTQMVAQDSEGNVVGGMQGNPLLPILWSGGSTPGAAPFRVDFLGKLFASDAEISGIINATSGTFKGFLRTMYLEVHDACAQDANGRFILGDYANIHIQSNELNLSEHELVLPIPSSQHIGKVINIEMDSALTRTEVPTVISCGPNVSDCYIRHPKALIEYTNYFIQHRYRPLHGIKTYSGGYIQLICGEAYWDVTVDGILDPLFNPTS